MSVQIGQQSSARSSRPVGLEGALRWSADGCAWANETASWNASANSARYDPALLRDRNQRILVTLHASPSIQSPRLAGSFSDNVTLRRQSGPSTIHVTCCKKTPDGLSEARTCRESIAKSTAQRRLIYRLTSIAIGALTARSPGSRRSRSTK